MKLKFISVLMISFIALFAVAPPLDAQTTTHRFKVFDDGVALNIRLDATSIDSAGTIWSQPIAITKYLGNNLATYPFDYSVRQVKTTATDSISTRYEIWSCGLDPSVNENWKIRDTIVTSAVAQATNPPVVTVGTAALANINNSTRPMFIKIKIVQLDKSKRHTLNFSFSRLKF